MAHKDKDPQAIALAEAEAQRRMAEYIDKIHYSDRYSDEEYEYRHVILPKPLMKTIPKDLFNPDRSGTLRLLTEDEWRGIGITQSLGWEHYEVHAPEPHVLLFRRRKNFMAPAHVLQQQTLTLNARSGLKLGRRK
ncbi:CKS-domain-containing protein [Laetiporus sulphureus 93-53]|uniref:Cyclin-dependent kinases regulatory subunit n=1 Tax=Laetiporus sulphureus 93-53 TaxID=1314785 RepID=A0A165C728_9APHY|nr:CKS-domain-containing protein [Laetiporus sulphureus 93-53]KZT02311.1 CKS-domain-containing protein [Laetiporus sulphureus 93-53]